MSAANQKPTRSLSSAAAAAALRARPHTPTNVAEVQTKRTMRRSSSVSSAGSASAASVSRPTAQLERRLSSSSMAERTFRTPSPHRASSIHAAEEHPPVPQIPTSHKKSASLGVGMQNFRTASQKLKTGSHSWYTEPSGDPSNVRTSDAPMRTEKPQLQKPQGIPAVPQRPDSRSSSMNFSYPTRFHAQSPPASPNSTQEPRFSSPPTQIPASPPRSNRASISSMTSAKSDQPMVYDRNSRRMVPRPIIENAEYQVRNTAGKQPRKKKGRGAQRESSELTKGTVARIKGTTVDADAVVRDLPRREQPVIEGTPTIEESRLLEDSEVKAIITTSKEPAQVHKNSEKAQPSQSERAAQQPTTSSSPRSVGSKAPLLQDEPRAVAKQTEPPVRPSQKVLDALDAVPTRQYIFEKPGDSLSPAQGGSEVLTQSSTDGNNSEKAQPAPEVAKEKRALFVDNKPVVGLSREGSSATRSNSNSPARQAHFSATPSDKLSVRHTPLPRSASPIKSALKQTSPTPREASPSDKSSDVSGSRGASPHQRDESAIRKKSVRVSFDDRSMATVVGESAPEGDTESTSPPSPQQNKRPWYSNIGRSKRREIPLDDDEIMKPRPTLPSFGSIREKKAKEIEERPLVRPYEPIHSPTTPSSPEVHPASTSDTTQAPGEASLGVSSDHALGLMLAQEQTQRNAPNISKFREPLPPVVTSVEGSGYISDSSIGSSDDDLLDSVAGASDTEEAPSTQITQPEAQNTSLNNSTAFEEKGPSESSAGVPSAIRLPPQEIPEIAVIQPSPRVPEHGTAAANLPGHPDFDLPGGFPESESDTTGNPQSTTRNVQGEEFANGASSVIFEPSATVHPTQPVTLPQTTLATTAPSDINVDESDDSDSSVYSDAYDYPLGAEGDGFLSLNAVVEDTIDEISSPQHGESSKGASKESDTIEAQAEIDNQTQSKLSNTLPELPRDQNDWERAKAFWRSLTAEKRLQLEREAIEEAATEGDQEEAATPPMRKNSNRKTMQRQKAVPETQSRISPPSQKPILAHPGRDHTAQANSNANHKLVVTSPPRESRMRTSLRSEHAGKAQASDGMRKTMRSHTNAPHDTPHASQPITRQTVQREKPTAVLSKSTQPRNVKATQALSTSKPGSFVTDDKPTLQRRGSDASDSSFKRSRASHGGGFTLRSSMRPQSVGTYHAATKGSGRFSLRSLSPAGSGFRHSSGAITTGGPPTSMMRHTLRSSSVSSQERLLPAIHFPSFGKSTKSPAKRSKRSSRFGDSSDEDEGGATGFRSRFDDSSDDESVRPSSSYQARPLSMGTLRPSTAGGKDFRKSTPVPEVDEESPELPDSEDEMPSPFQSPRARPNVNRAGLPRSNSEALGTTTLTRSRSGRGGFNTSVSMPAVSHKERRSSLMGILRLGKRADPASKIQRSSLTESAARRDTRLERSSEQLKDIRGDNISSPRLQKRASVKRNESWPLGEPFDGSMKRSNSVGDLLGESIAADAVERPTLNNRRSTSQGLVAGYDNEQGDVTVDGLGNKKKKKFGALRRMFGLDD